MELITTSNIISAREQNRNGKAGERAMEMDFLPLAVLVDEKKNMGMQHYTFL